jgi:hypothetical protein
MSEQTAKKLERLNARNEVVKEQIRSSILQRWGDTDWNIRFPWWREPSEVRILMYADGDVRFVGLKYVKELLETRPYPNVSFKITTAHREGDSQATITNPVQLTQLNILADFDEIWLFGFNNLPKLTDDEVALVDKFMASPKLGGVLVTGDHFNLGQGLAGAIPRVGTMRLWTVDALGTNRHSSLEEGPDVNLTFDDEDQSDDRPQTIHYRRFPVEAPLGVRLQPHPVLCGPDGPIDVLPDHQHEGEAVAPQPQPGDPIWPTNAAGHQEHPFVIAWGDIKDPQVHYRQFGVISAYNGHTVDVGRIVADSSWHHWLDINLLGKDDQPPYNGFDATPEGQAILKKIDAYFLNCGVWLAPPQKQGEMRNAAWWSILWTDQIVESPPDAPFSYFGERATRALKQFASSCAVSEWVLGPVTFNNALSDWKLAQVSERSSLFNLSLEQYVAGGILRALMREVGPFNPEIRFPTEAPPDDRLELAINKGTAEALSSIESQLESEASHLLTVIAKNFRRN